MLTYLQFTDDRLLQLLNQTIKCRVLDVFMNIVTHLGSLPTVILVWAVLRYSGHPTWANMADDFALVMIVSQCMVHILKHLINRPRPFENNEEVVVIYAPTSQYSFPSAHSSAAMVMGLCLSTGIPTAYPLWAALTLLVALSRVYLGAHYPSDVLVGLLLGLLSWLLLI